MNVSKKDNKECRLIDPLLQDLTRVETLPAEASSNRLHTPVHNSPPAQESQNHKTSTNRGVTRRVFASSSFILLLLRARVSLMVTLIASPSTAGEAVQTVLYIGNPEIDAEEQCRQTYNIEKLARTALHEYD